MTMNLIARPPYQELMDRILKYFTGAGFEKEFSTASREYFGSLNLLETKTENFDLKMQQFFDWYFFSRNLSGYGVPPIEACKLVRELRFSEEDENWLGQLRSFKHSLFEFIKVKGKDIVIYDLFLKKKMLIKDCPWTFGFEKEELFEARLLPFEGEWTLTQGILFHPAAVKKFLLTEVKKYRKDPDLDFEFFLFRMAQMRSRMEQYQHLKPEVIYANETKLL